MIQINTGRRIRISWVSRWGTTRGLVANVAYTRQNTSFISSPYGLVHTQLGIFEKGRISFHRLAFRSHVNGISGNKNGPQSGVFEEVRLSFSCERAKRRFSKNDDALHRISTVLVFSCGRAKTIRIRQRILRKYSEVRKTHTTVSYMAKHWNFSVYL